MTTSTTTTTPEQRVTTLFKLLENGSNKQHIDGKMSQLDQALHVTQLVGKDGADPETLLAALFQDVGHVCPAPEGSAEADDEDEDKDEDAKSTIDYRMRGANYLRQLGFPKKTCDLVESDVMGKRYVAALVPMYEELISSASKELLKLQGGPFTPTEAQAFEKDPLFKEKVLLVNCNFAAKVTEDKPPALETYRGLTTSMLYRQFIENQQRESQANMELTKEELASLEKEYGITEKDL
ncbi:hypothetical protein GGI01_001645 [Coemansia sp. RSA 376]|nr:hypothetical protein H4S03_001745 [Coemansia sp. S3946]KAJ2049295.1 hypothetical protein H4S04_003316 [Coemansia sp. S16]KAJ2074429.1 hypothetical protein GGH13_001331 [Coemansia sp. S155-1]KAJ2114291.1 hypothetical protein IW146_003208 [Coemansia sp. RSA 922]KAJ2262303.1 hypothetical protein GGI01_001645 [Coemansia sp. RSA 376]KAJ2353695.1 hypothetical protein GGH92_000496 [Coemansia sp. RSA 2673]